MREVPKRFDFDDTLSKLAEAGILLRPCCARSRG